MSVHSRSAAAAAASAAVIPTAGSSGSFAAGEMASASALSRERIFRLAAYSYTSCNKWLQLRFVSISVTDYHRAWGFVDKLSTLPRKAYGLPEKKQPKTLRTGYLISTGDGSQMGTEGSSRTI
ncbi:hypothetical protein AXG93_1793s1170 [Marchantia polymorpha subsp. ruderalis]|uniref:Uncharacterized protein n=1 Tax=Marchantia polymorpha subsp. ruderalis TaxID=1480154 RepID=A0A176WJ38_MARPO|nr:hypothetical protein AXG93_1793s1170 [Marchantia polymorpha subsp. ruderalis]